MSQIISGGIGNGGGGPSTFPSVVDIDFQTVIGSSVVDFTKYASLADDDWLVYITHAENDSQSYLAAELVNNWRKVGHIQTSTNPDRSLAIFTKYIVDASAEPATYVLGSSGSTSKNAALLVVRSGASGCSMVDVRDPDMQEPLSIDADNDAPSQEVSEYEYKTNVSNVMVLSTLIQQNLTAFTAPGGFGGTIHLATDGVASRLNYFSRNVASAGQLAPPDSTWGLTTTNPTQGWCVAALGFRDDA